MFNTLPQGYNLNSVLTSYRVTPVGRIEETSSIFPDISGNPLFFYDQSRNEFYVKQRKIQTGEVEILRYTLSVEPLSEVKTSEDINSYEEQLNELKNEINSIKEMLEIKKEV